MRISYTGDEKMKQKLLIIIGISLIVLGTAIRMFEMSQKENKMDVKIPILLYHDFVSMVPETDPDDFNYINTPEGLEENIQVLLENGYTFISFEELEKILKNELPIPQKPILLTLDDGYASNYQYAYPILEKYDIPASIFVVTDNIGRTIDGKQYLTWEECKMMENSNLVKIYSHSKEHLFYNRFPVRKLKDDVKYSYKIIEEKLGKREIKVFAYPYGAYTKETVWILKKNRIDMQVYDIGINNLQNFDKHYIRRFNIPCEMTGKEIINMINNTE